MSGEQYAFTHDAYVMVALDLKFCYFSSQVVYVGYFRFEFFQKVSVGLWGRMLCGFVVPKTIGVCLRNLLSVISTRLASFGDLSMFSFG